MNNMEFIKLTKEERIATVTIDHPPVNALSSKVMEEMDRAMNELNSDGNIRVIIITGSGSLVFVAGADIKELAALSSATQAQPLVARGQDIINKIENLNKVVICAINGVCLGGGNELAMACHIRIAGDRTRFGQPEINLGIIPGFGGTQRLPRIVGAHKAIELILTGDMITAQEALQIGLVNKVVPHGNVLKYSKDLAKKIALKGNIAISTALKAIREGLRRPLSDGLALEAELFSKLCETEDMREGLRAFIEKRQPKFL